jgi:predicted outer membrane repeat protein
LDLLGTTLAGNAVVALGHGGSVAIAGTRTTIDGCTFAGNSCYGDGGALFSDAAELRVLRSTIIGNESAQGTIALANGSTAVLESALITANAIVSVSCGDGSSAALSCCDIYGNSNPSGTVDGDWVPCIAGQAGTAGNIWADPRFCSAAPVEEFDFTLRIDSPCAPPQSTCGLIGAWAVACDADPVEASTWGRIKSRYQVR